MLATAGQVPAEETASWMAQVKGPQGLEANMGWGGCPGESSGETPSVLQRSWEERAGLEEEGG